MAFQSRFRETERHAFGGRTGAGYDGSSGMEPGELIQQLEADLVTFRGCVDAVGSQHDSLENRDQLKELRTKILSQITQCEQKLAAQKKSGDPQSKITFDRLSRQLNSQVDQFTDLMEREKVSSRKHSQSFLVASGHEPSAPSPTPTSQSSQQALVTMDAVEIREREAEELQDLEKDIVGLRDIQRDLATLVDNQGDDILRIDKNVAQAEVRVSEGVRQTDHAVVLHKKNLRIKLVIGGIIAAVVIVILIIVIVLLAVLVPRAQS